MALQPHLQYTSLGSGPRTVEFWLDYACPHCKRCNLTLEELVPRVLPGGAWHGQVRFLIRPYSQPWDNCSALLTATSLALGRAITTDNIHDDAAVWFAGHSELFRRQGDFKGQHTDDMTVSEIKDNATDVLAAVAAKQRKGTAEAHSAKIRDVFVNGSNG